MIRGLILVLALAGPAMAQAERFTVQIINVCAEKAHGDDITNLFPNAASIEEKNAQLRQAGEMYIQCMLENGFRLQTEVPNCTPSNPDRDLVSSLNDRVALMPFRVLGVCYERIR